MFRNLKKLRELKRLAKSETEIEYDGSGKEFIRMTVKEDDGFSRRMQSAVKKCCLPKRVNFSTVRLCACRSKTNCTSILSAIRFR